MMKTPKGWNRMATTKGQKIAEYAESKIGCAYIWGGYGEKLCTPDFRRERAEAYPAQKSNIYRYCQVLSGQKTMCSGCRYNGKQAYDCAQLTRYACKAGGKELVSGANSQWKSGVWEQKGTMDTFPDEPGVILYHANSEGTMTHTGVAVGSGMAVEARSAAYGVVKTVVKNRSWTHWAALPGVLSEGAGIPSTPAESKQESPAAVENGVTMKTIRKGDTGTQVQVLQWLLNENGCDCGSADGIMGRKTLAAVREYQKLKGLTVDGIVGKATWTALLK